MRRLLLAGLPLLLASSCHEVAEVLRAGSADAAAGSGGAAAPGGTTGSGGSFPVGGDEGGDGKEPDPTLADSLSAGQTHTCLARAGLVYCWGDNAGGQLGTGDREPRWVPTLVVGSKGVVEVAAGGQHTCWLTRDGAVWCFGSNAYGQLGQPGVSDQLVPARVALPERAVAIDAAYGHSCAILTTSELYCWGENVETQLGQGDAPDENHWEPLQVAVPGEVSGVACGQGTTAAFTKSGELYGWGRNSTGECGLGEGRPIRIRTPTLIPNVSGVTAIDAGQSSACVLTAGGALSCWGVGTEQHLGTGSDDTLWSAQPVLPGLVWAKISLDTFHSCGIDPDQHLYCWGRAIEGQLGQGPRDTPQPMPTAVQGSYRAVSAGRFHTCVVAADDRVLCTGANTAGELGVGDTDRRHVFTQVSLPP